MAQCCTVSHSSYTRHETRVAHCVANSQARMEDGVIIRYALPIN